MSHFRDIPFLGVLPAVKIKIFFRFVFPVSKNPLNIKFQLEELFENSIFRPLEVKNQFSKSSPNLLKFCIQWVFRYREHISEGIFLILTTGSYPTRGILLKCLKILHALNQGQRSIFMRRECTQSIPRLEKP